MGSGRSKSSRTSWTSSRSLCQVGTGVPAGAVASVQAGLLPDISACCFEKRMFHSTEGPLCPCTGVSSLKVILRGISEISGFPGGSTRWFRACSVSPALLFVAAFPLRK